MSVKDIPREKLQEVAKYLDRFAELKPGEDEEDQKRYFELLLEELKGVEAPRFQYTNVQVVEFGFDSPSWKLLCDLSRKELGLELFVHCLRKIKCTKALNVFRAATSPVITSQPVSVTVKQGETILLSIDAECQPGKPVFQWFNNDKVPLPKQTSRTLLIHHANGAHTGFYNCHVANPFINEEAKKYVFSQWAEVTVIVPEPVESVPRQETNRNRHIPSPTITVHPSPFTTHHGGSAVMECSANGAELYEWFRNGKRVTDKQGCDSAQLRLDPVSIEDTGEYECRTINEGGDTLSKPAKLTVDSGIEITEQPSDMMVKAGEDIVLHCSARAVSGQDLVYRWFKKQGAENHFVEEGSTLKETTSNKSRYWTKSTPKSRKYFCEVGYDQRREISVTSKMASVTIQTVWFTEHPKETKGVLDTRVVLKCRAEGALQCSYKWLAFETRSGKNKKVKTDGNVKINGRLLTFEKLEQAHLGYYQCQARNVIGDLAESDVVEVSAVLPGREAPVITFLKEPWSWVLFEGQPFRLVCQAQTSGDPPLHHQWFHNGEEIKGAEGEEYIVKSLTAQDYGDYYCEVSTHKELTRSLSKHASVSRPFVPKKEEEDEEEEEEVDGPTFVPKSGEKLEQQEAERKLLTDKEERYARQKVALLIGNQTYQSDFNSNLRSPEHDILELRKTLESLDFKVIALIDLTFVEMRKALDQFYEMLAISGVYAVFYYSGHGFSYVNNTFLMPVDATVPLNADYNICANEICAKMQGRLSRALLVFDCCQVDRNDTTAQQKTFSAPKNILNRVIITSCFNQQRAYDGDMEPLGVVEHSSRRQPPRPSSSCSDFNIAFRKAISQKRNVDQVFQIIIDALKKAGVSGRGDTDQRADIIGRFYDHDGITLHDRVMLDDPKIEDQVDRMVAMFKLASFIPEPVFIEGEALGELQGVAKIELMFAEKYSNVLLVSVFLHLLREGAALKAVDCDEETLRSQGLTLTMEPSLAPSEEEGDSPAKRVTMTLQPVYRVSGLQKLEAQLKLKIVLSVRLAGGEEEGREEVGQYEVEYTLPRNPLFANLLHNPPPP